MWVSLLWIYILGPHFKENAELEWRDGSRMACERDLVSLPKEFRVDGFVAELPILRKEDILFLLSERHIKFIEIRVKADDNSEHRFIGLDRHWTVSAKEGTYARINLGVKGDPDCAELPYSMKGRETKPPFLPDTCVKVSYAEKPSARYALELQHRPNGADDKYNNWAIVDRMAGKNIATLTTSDTQRNFRGGVIDRNDHWYHENDCWAPASIFTQRIRGIEDSKYEFPQILEKVRVTAKPDIVDVNSSVANIVVAPAVEHLMTYTKSESESLRSSGSSHVGWEAAISQAKISGWGNYGEILLDWANRQYIALSDSNDAKNHRFAWNVLSVGNGFLAISHQAPWNMHNEGVLIRYRSDGTADWAARIEAQATTKDVCERFIPRTVYVEGEFLVLANSCEEEARFRGKSSNGVAWKVPLRALPGKL